MLSLTKQLLNLTAKNQEQQGVRKMASVPVRRIFFKRQAKACLSGQIN
jgi:hypothetical protein